MRSYYFYILRCTSFIFDRIWALDTKQISKRENILIMFDNCHFTFETKRAKKSIRTIVIILNSSYLQTEFSSEASIKFSRIFFFIIKLLATIMPDVHLTTSSPRYVLNASLHRSVTGRTYTEAQTCVNYCTRCVDPLCPWGKCYIIILGLWEIVCFSFKA